MVRFLITVEPDEELGESEETVKGLLEEAIRDSGIANVKLETIQEGDRHGKASSTRAD